MTRLEVNSGETYTIGAGDEEEWVGADVSGTVDVDGTLWLYEDANPPSQGPGEDDAQTFPLDLQLPLATDLPTQPLTTSNMQTGVALFLVGVLFVLGAAAAVLRNYAAGVVLGLGFLALIMSGTLGIGLEWFWGLVMLCVVVLIAGLGVRIVR